MKKFLAVLVFLVSQAAFPCMELPKKVRQTNTSFSKEVFEVSSGVYGPQIINGTTKFFFNYKKSKWCSVENEASSEVSCFSQGANFNLVDSAEKVVGSGVINGNALVIFSVNAKGQQSTSMPYMRISADTVATKEIDVKTEYKTTLRIESIAANKQTDGVFIYEGKFGTYEEDGKFKQSGPRTRGLPIQEKEASLPTDGTTLNGQNSLSTAGCSSRIETKPFQQLAPHDDKSGTKAGAVIN